MPESKLESLKRKLAARKDMPGYEENRRELEAEIARLEAEQDDLPSV